MNKWLATGIVAVALMVAEFPVSNMKAQDTATPEQNQTVGSLMQDHRYYGAGLQGSFLSGTGISGRVSFPSRLVLATSITVLSTGENATFFTIGSNAQYSFSRRDAGRFFALIGAGYYSGTCERKDGNCLDDPLRLGAGFGYEWFVTHSIGLSAALPITWHTSSGTVFPTPEVGMFFYFR